MAISRNADSTNLQLQTQTPEHSSPGLGLSSNTLEKRCKARRNRSVSPPKDDVVAHHPSLPPRNIYLTRLTSSRQSPTPNTPHTGMSCPPQHQHQQPQQQTPDPTQAISDDEYNNDALSSSSDYGSDFSADETDLLNQLLAQADATATDSTTKTTIPRPPSQHQHEHQQSSSRQVPVPAFIPAPVPIPDIEDLGTGGEDDAAGGSRVPRVLGREKKWPLWQVQKAGGALSDAREHKAGWVPIFRGPALGTFLPILHLFTPFFSTCV